MKKEPVHRPAISAPARYCFRIQGIKAEFQLNRFGDIAGHRWYDGYVGCGNLLEQKVRLYSEMCTVQISATGTANQMHVESCSGGSLSEMVIRQVEDLEQTDDAAQQHTAARQQNGDMGHGVIVACMLASALPRRLSTREGGDSSGGARSLLSVPQAQERGRRESNDAEMNVMRFIRCIALVAVASVGSPVAGVAAPIDELERFAGTWQSQGTFVETPYSKAGPATATTTCAWSGDRLFMICQQVVTMAGKRDDDLGIYSYDETSGSYRFYNVHPGRTTDTTITVHGDTITYPFSFTDNGKNVTIRTLNVWKSADLYTWRTEYSTDAGANWALMASGTSRKQ